MTFDMLNKFEDVWCERVYSPWMDLDEIMRKEQIPLFALESQDPVKDFDFLGITLQYDMHKKPNRRRHSTRRSFM